MCIVIPQKIIKVENNQAFFENGNIASLNIQKAKVGDYVFVKEGLVINKLDNTEACKNLELLKEFKTKLKTKN